jgi:ATP-dependent helicase/nuclease subunit A
MSADLVDQVARERFRREWTRNFAVSANAGSGKTTAISERLAEMALSDEAARVLPKTAVVTFTKKAAHQIGRRARTVLLRRLAEEGRTDLSALDHLERTFFGTIHSFCLLLARRYGQSLGINLNPAVVAEEDERCWEEFLEQDVMTFTSLPPEQLDPFLRHVPLEAIFDLARSLDAATARELQIRLRGGLRPMPAPDEAILRQLLALPAKGRSQQKIETSQRAATAWMERWKSGRGFLPLYTPVGSSAALVELASDWMAPLKKWLAEAGSLLAAELSGRYRLYRFERGVQTYADQIDAAVAVLRDRATLEKIREEGWRVILDEAQDTDPQQFAVLVEITRPVGAEPGVWPARSGDAVMIGPRAGHFCLVGDGQQSIYGSRADIRNFLRHLAAFERGDCGELLSFHVTFRAPHRVIAFLNEGLPDAFSASREHNCGLPAAEGAPAPYLQVPYEMLAAGPANVEGCVARLPLIPPAVPPRSVDEWMAADARQVAEFLRGCGPGGLGVRHWGEVALLAPRNSWLLTVQKAMEAAGLKVALQTRKNRNGDNPAYAWITGLLAAVCDPDNAFEWFGVLREIFGIPDAVLAKELRERGRFQWDSTEAHVAEIAGALEKVRPWIMRADDEGMPLGALVHGLAEACGLPAKAHASDPGGIVTDELIRLLAFATEKGLEGVGARAWLEMLLAEIDEGRPAGKPEESAINLLTAHSAKGLEWPVVIPLGLWRRVTSKDDNGLRLVRETGGDLRIYFDQASMSDETKLARQREQWRELTRLLYVTLTRPRHTLVIPWGEGFGGKSRGAGVSFAELWGGDGWHQLPEAQEKFESLSVVAVPPNQENSGTSSEVEVAKFLAGQNGEATARSIPLTQLPQRLLPHQLAGETTDRLRSLRHEASSEESRALPDGGEAIDYGLWWHETMEFMPWGQPTVEIKTYLDEARAAAEALGFGQRADKELALLTGSGLFSELSASNWARLAELAVFAPIQEDAWMDGVIDFALHDSGKKEVWVVDWKTNGRRAGEAPDAMRMRLLKEYAPQLRAYGEAMLHFFPAHGLRLWLYISALGDFVPVPMT